MKKSTSFLLIFTVYISVASILYLIGPSLPEIKNDPIKLSGFFLVFMFGMPLIFVLFVTPSELSIGILLNILCVISAFLLEDIAKMLFLLEEKKYINIITGFIFILSSSFLFTLFFGIYKNYIVKNLKKT